MRARGAVGPDSIGVSEEELTTIVQWASGVLVELCILGLVIKGKIEPTVKDGEVYFSSI